MHGFRPGPYLISETPHLVYAIFGAMLFANFAFLGIGLVGAKFFSYVTFIPKRFLWPSVFVFSLIFKKRRQAMTTNEGVYIIFVISTVFTTPSSPFVSLTIS